MFIIDFLHWLTSDQGLMAVLAHNWLLGTLIIAAIVYLETGVVVTPFLPGDSLLFAAGACLGVAGIDPIPSILIITTAAVLGNWTNYAIAQSRLGQQIIQRGWIRPKHLAKTQAYFEKFGGSTITVSRFVPIVRTIAPFMAGLAGMNAKKFQFFNIAGGLAWCVSLILAGVSLGKIPWIREHIGWVSIIIIVLSMIPVAFHLKPSKT